MREIKFRAWDSENNCKKLSIGKMELFDDMLAFRFNHFDQDPEDVIFEQFTGLCDKNGREIYEGDIIESHGFRGQIFYRFDLARFACTPEVYDINGAIIIGNIHENPELLNG